MGREIRRVPLDFNWPIGEIWSGYLMPEHLELPICEVCGGSRYSSEATYLHHLWYGMVPFQPTDNGSTPYTMDDPEARELAERNVAWSPVLYGRGEAAIRKETARIVDLWNGRWSNHLNQDDVDALVAAGRLCELTRTFTNGSWVEDPTRPALTAMRVNAWNLKMAGHDAVDAMVCVRARCEREGLPISCQECGGEGTTSTPEQVAAYEAWEPTDPPEGHGWQLWETTTEGSPQSPVFATSDMLAEWIAQNPCGFGGASVSLETAKSWIRGYDW